MGREGHWDLYRSMLAVIRKGSLSAAARDLRFTQPTVGRHIEQLEEILGVALFTRSPTGLIATPAALSLLQHAEAMEASAAALLRAASGATGIDKGTVRITASEATGAQVIIPLLASIRARHPGIEFEIVLNNRSDDLLRRDADIAVRMFRPEQSALVARRVGVARIALYAHKSYVESRGSPKTLDEIGNFDLIGFDRDDISFRAAAKDLAITRDIFTFRADSDLACHAALLAGLGIGGCQTHVARGNTELVPVLHDALSFKLEAWLVMHADQRDVRPIRLVYDALAEGLTAIYESTDS
jgi:DNA-binding transcriptional LysR family regulator